MSTTKTEILALVQMLCWNLADATEIDRFFGEAEVELAKDPRLWQLSHLVSTQNTPEYLVSSALNVTAVFYGGRELLEASRAELDATTRQWREEFGTPIVYTKDAIDDHKFRLYPQRDSTPASATDFFATNVTTTNIPDILSLPLALFILAREFSRESNHRDLIFATECNKMANELLGMVA